MKRSDRFRNVPWAVATVVFLAASLYLLFLAMASFPVGLAYAIWTGIGAVCTLIAGMILFKEPADVRRMFFAVLTIAGIIGLYITAGV
jgi:quaternary ammonium compound-resistance protein SugE